MQLLLTRDYDIGYAQTDPKGNMRPSCLLSIMQDIAGRHSNILGNSRDVLMERYHAFWMLVRVQYSLNRPVSGDEKLTVETWARSIKGVMTYRDFAFYIEEEYVGNAQSAWVVADFETRKMLRLSSVGLTASFLNPDRSEGEDIGHIRFPEPITHSHDKVVRISDLDVNYHLNNTKYADIVLDALDLDSFSSRFISHFQLNFLQECLMGETISVNSSKDKDWLYVCGIKEGKHCFDSKLQLSALPIGKDE